MPRPRQPSIARTTSRSAAPSQAGRSHSDPGDRAKSANKRHAHDRGPTSPPYTRRSPRGRLRPREGSAPGVDQARKLLPRLPSRRAAYGRGPGGEGRPGGQPRPEMAPMADGAGQDGRERPGLALALAGEQRGDVVALIEPRVEQRVLAGPAGAGGKYSRNGRRHTRRSGWISPRNRATSSSSGLASGSSPDNPTHSAKVRLACNRVGPSLRLARIQWLGRVRCDHAGFRPARPEPRPVQR